MRSEYLSRQRAGPHQKLVDRISGLPALSDRPNHKRLTAAHVAGRKYLADRTDVLICIGLHVAPLIERHAQIPDHALVNRMHESHREQYEIGREFEFGSGDRLET